MQRVHIPRFPVPNSPLWIYHIRAHQPSAQTQSFSPSLKHLTAFYAPNCNHSLLRLFLCLLGRSPLMLFRTQRHSNLLPQQYRTIHLLHLADLRSPQGRRQHLIHLDTSNTRSQSLPKHLSLATSGYYSSAL